MVFAVGWMTPTTKFCEKSDCISYSRRASLFSVIPSSPLGVYLCFFFLDLFGRKNNLFVRTRLRAWFQEKGASSDILEVA